jgi:hypothetical protein
MSVLRELTWLQWVALLGTIGGLGQTWWISLRQNLAAHRAALPRRRAGRWKARVRFWLPYALILTCYSVLLAAALWPRDRNIKHHEITTISSSSHEDSTNLVGCSSAEVYSSAPHFKVDIDGVLYGPELGDLRAQYGHDLKAVRVYAIVAEESQPEKRDLLWIQANESGRLGGDGHYTTSAYFKGTGAYSAREGDRFSVRIYVPKDANAKLPLDPFEGTATLPAHVFLSAPVTVRTLRAKPLRCPAP